MKSLTIVFPLLNDLEKEEYGYTIGALLLCNPAEIDQTIVQKINDAFDAGVTFEQNGKKLFTIKITTEEEYKMLLNEITSQRDCIAYESGYTPYNVNSDTDERIFVLTDIISRLGLYRLFDAPEKPLYDGMGAIIRRQ